MKKNTSWGNVAEWYFKYLQDEDSYQSQVIAPNLLRLMDIKPGEKILDLACGSGFFSELFHAQGGEVIGVDIAPELIELARKHASPEIKFIVASADDIQDIPSGSIQKIACILALQNIQDVKKVFEACSRVLTPNGSLFLVLNHPAFRIPGGSSWSFDLPSPKVTAPHDEKSGQHYRRIDSYMTEKKVEIAMHPGKQKSETTISFHRPLQYFTKTLANSGFYLARLEEWISHKKSEHGPRQKEEDRIRKEIPLFIMLECIRKN
jgi:ubiquinone/menaquinone biosynthesis C-methylase UbiE